MGINVTRISMTAVPVDRPPFPLPSGVNVPVFFTVQPGGSVLIPPRAQIVYPNFTSEPAGGRVNFWNYDPTEKGWYIYGQGTVTDDRKQIIPDAGVVIYEFNGIMISTANRPPGTEWDCGAWDGDPVNLATGLFVLNSTDLVMPDTLPLSITRTYRPGDSASYSFGRGAVSGFDLMLYDATPGGEHWKEVYLILPDGGRVRYDRISPGAGWVDSVMENSTGPNAFFKSRIRWNSYANRWELTLKDGSVLVWGDSSPLESIRDRYGNQIKIFRTNGVYGNMTRVTAPNGRWIDFTYDANSRITQVRDNTSRAVNYTYDASGRLWKVTDPAGGVTEYTYDSSHRMLTIKDARGIVYLTNQYDSNGRVILQTQADNTTYQFAYTLDGNGKVTQTDVTDPRGNHRIATFNSSGYRLTDTEGCSCGSGVTYERQAGTNFITAMTDALGRRTQYAYDPMGNVTSVTRMAGTSEAVITSFAYEGTYQQIGSVTDALNHTTAFTYDPAGNLIRVTDPLNHQTTMAYNASGQPTSVTDALNNTTQFTYDAVGRRTTMTVPGQATVNYIYDNADRLTQITQASSTVTFAYDASDRRTSLTLPNGVITEYSYNPAQVVGLTYRKGATVLGNLTYEYDGAGRRVRVGGSFARTNLPGAVTSASYNAANQQIAFAAQSLTYDLNGNLTSDGANNYAWNARDQLVSVAGPGVAAAFQYDGTRRRVAKTVNGVATQYLFDAENVVQEKAGGTVAANLLTGSLDEIFHRWEASGSWSLLVEALGSTIALSDTAGTLPAEYTYEPFGTTTASGTVTNNSSQFTARENDAAEFYYYRNRYYSPSLQRFISEDPLEYEGGDTNLYAYVLDNPISRTDPLGLLSVAFYPDRFGGLHSKPPVTGGRKDNGSGAAVLGTES